MAATEDRIRKAAIIVRTRDPTKTCFLVTPFREELDPVSSLVERAALQVGLKPIRTDRIQSAPDFPSDIMEGIRTARVVVAILSPAEGSDAALNPNVAYELGLAHALGKPTLLLTNRPDLVPSNLTARYRLDYRQADHALLHQIEAKLHQLKDRQNSQGRRLTDPAEDFAFETEHWVLVNTETWAPFLEVLRFAKRSHHELQDSDIYLNAARGELQEILSKPEMSLRDLTAVQNKRLAIAQHFMGVQKRSLLNPSPSELELLDRYLKELLSAAPAIPRAQILSCQQTYSILKTKLEEYQANQLESETMREVSLDEAGAFSYFRDLSKVSHQTTSMLIQADSLILGLVEALAR